MTDAFGTGTSVNRCILEIYHGDKFYDRIEKGVSGKTVTFDNLRLVSSQTYDFVFWADCAEGSEGNFTDKVYNTANLKSITENRARSWATATSATRFSPKRVSKLPVLSRNR